VVRGWDGLRKGHLPLLSIAAARRLFSVSAQLGSAFAAILYQERDQTPHAIHSDCVKDSTFSPPRVKQTGTLQQAEVVGKRRGGNTHAGGDLAGRQSTRSCFNQQAKRRETVLVCECGQGSNSFTRFHVSRIIEITREFKVASLPVFTSAVFTAIGLSTPVASDGKPRVGRQGHIL
jgi:hypothetical protein